MSARCHLVENLVLEEAANLREGSGRLVFRVYRTNFLNVQLARATTPWPVFAYPAVERHSHDVTKASNDEPVLKRAVPSSE
jgi:hypothetical protein